MRIEQIREKVSKNFYDKLTSKQVLCDWLGGSTTNFDVGLTLMPKKVFYKTQSSRKGFKKTEVLRHLTSAELRSGPKNLNKPISGKSATF